MNQETIKARMAEIRAELDAEIRSGKYRPRTEIARLDKLVKEYDDLELQLQASQKPEEKTMFRVKKVLADETIVTGNMCAIVAVHDSYAVIDKDNNLGGFVDSRGRLMEGIFLLEKDAVQQAAIWNAPTETTDARTDVCEVPPVLTPSKSCV